MNELMTPEKEKKDTYFQDSPIGMFELDAKGRITRINKLASKFTGFTKGELLEGMTFFNLFGEKDIRSIVGFEVLLDDGILNAELTLIGKDELSTETNVIATRIDNDSFLVYCIDISKYKSIETESKKLNSIMQVASTLIMLADDTGDIIFCSPSVTELTGYEQEEIMGDKWYQLTFLDQNEGQRVKREMVQNGNGVVMETRQRKILCKDGTLKWIEWFGSKNSEGAHIGIGTVITERINAEKRIIKQKEKLIKAKSQIRESADKILKFSTAVEQSADSVILTNSKGLIEYVNPRFTMTSGYTKDEVLGKSPGILKSGKHDDSVYKDLWNTISKGETWKGTLQNKSKNGKLYWEDITIIPIKNNSGEITNFLANKEDISMKKKVEEMYDWSRILEHANWGTVIREPDGVTISSMNPTFAAMHGYFEDELKGQPITILFPKNEYDRFLKVNLLTSDMDKYSYESIHIRKDGVCFPVEINASVVRDDDGNIKNFIATLFDVSDKKRLESKNKEIKDSIVYAKTIQQALLPSMKNVKNRLKDCFIIYKPKDIVAGDFYWLETSSNLDSDQNPIILFAAADCTGHGVPGAMVSVVCNNALNRSVREYKLTDPGKILDKTRDIVIQEFEKSEQDVQDGMDIALCSLEGNILKYAGAHNPLWIIRNGRIIEQKADKQPIGKFEKKSPYATHTFELLPKDSIYLFTDGYVDQFGGEKGKKFKSRAFKYLLLSIQHKSMDNQKLLIDEAFEKWKGKLEQIDDVCIIGVKI